MLKIREAYELIFREYPDVVNVEQMCEMLGGISVKTGYRLLREKRIRHFRIGRVYKIPKLHILTYLAVAQESNAQKIVRTFVNRAEACYAESVNGR